MKALIGRRKTERLGSRAVTSEEDEQLRIRRMFGVVRSAEQRAIESLAKALAVHREEVGDPQAELALKPIDAESAASLADSLGCITGYRKIQLADVFGRSEGEFESWLAAQLTDSPIESVDYEAIWALGQVIVLYVRAEPGRDL